MAAAASQQSNCSAEQTEPNPQCPRCTVFWDGCNCGVCGFEKKRIRTETLLHNVGPQGSTLRRQRSVEEMMEEAFENCNVSFLDVQEDDYVTKWWKFTTTEGTFWFKLCGKVKNVTSYCGDSVQVAGKNLSQNAQFTVYWPFDRTTTIHSFSDTSIAKEHYAKYKRHKRAIAAAAWAFCTSQELTEANKLNYKEGDGVNTTQEWIQYFQSSSDDMLFTKYMKASELFELEARKQKANPSASASARKRKRR